MNLLPKRWQYATERDGEHATASCAVVFDKIGESKLHLANMDIHRTITSEMVGWLAGCFTFHNFIIQTFSQIIKHEALISAAPIVLFDANISVDTMGTILELCEKYDKPGEFGFVFPRKILQYVLDFI